MTTFVTALASSSVLDLTICGCVALIGVSACSYRLTTRWFGWGPLDT